jgi:membrane associated rhomboid family serine protease
MNLSATLVIIALTAAASLVALGNPRMLEALMMWTAAVRRGEWYRLLSYGFVHADFGHLLFNMITLYFFGKVVESFYVEHLGQFGFYIFYVMGLLASILPSYFDHRGDPDYRSLGASGAVSAVLFAYILFQPWSGIIFFPIPVPIPAVIYAVLYVGYSLYEARRGKGRVNHSAHLWGGAFGVAFTLVLEPELVSRFLDALSRPHFG